MGPTNFAKYYAVQRVTHELFPDLLSLSPRSRQAGSLWYLSSAWLGRLVKLADQLGPDKWTIR